MYYFKFSKALLLSAILLAISIPASAALTLYEQNDATFSVDGSFNTFYVYSESDAGGTDTTQSRVKMGFLPNWIGFNFSKKIDNLTLGGRSSFWVTINDSDNNPTDTAIDVRQFYGTVEGDWGQVLFGKDFTLFSRTNIFLDEILQGFGKTAGLDATGVSFGNIGSGYIYPLPSAQITYRSPDLAGLKLAVGIIDPSRTSGAGGEEEIPRIEGEVTFSKSFDQGSVTAWAGFMTQTSENSSGDVDSQGISYGVNAKFAGFSLTGSGFTAEGVDTSLGAFGTPTANEDSSGYLLQGSYTIDKIRLVASYGKTEVDNATDDEDETIIGAVFYTLNDYLKLSGEYNVENVETGGADTEIKTVALGLILNF